MERRTLWAGRSKILCILKYATQIIVVCMIFSSIQAQSTTSPQIQIETNKGCGSDALFALSEDLYISFQLQGAAPSSQYEYWITDYADSGRILGSWTGSITTDSAGESATESAVSIASLPVGRHSIQVQIPELDLQETCDYYVEGSTLIPGLLSKPTGLDCYCEEMDLLIDLDKTAVVSGDAVTISVTVDNTMQCPYIFGSKSLLIDLGELGGLVYPLAVDRKVDEGEQNTIAVYQFTVPAVADGYYPINMVYIEPYCTWAFSVLLRVGTAGAFSVTSLPEPQRIEEEESIDIEVTNSLQNAQTYTIAVQAPESITFGEMPENSYTVQVGAQSSVTVSLVFFGSAEGDFPMTFVLSAGDQILDEISITVTIREPAAASLELVTPPSVMSPDETVYLHLKITNNSRREYTYRISAAVQGDLSLSETSWEIDVPREESQSLSIPVTAAGDTPASIDFELFQDDQLMDFTTWNVTVDKDSNALMLFAIGAGVAAVAGGAAYINLRSNGETLGEEVESDVFDRPNNAEEYVRAGESAETGGELEQAGEWYEKAAEAYKEIEKIEKAAKFYKEAANAWKKLDKLRRALENKEKAARLYEAAGSRAEEDDKLEKAADFYEKAADVWYDTEKTDNAEQAIQLYLRAANIWNQLHNSARAIKVLNKAAEICEKIAALAYQIREYEVAANYYEKATDMLRTAGRKKKSGKLCEKVMNLRALINDVAGAHKAEEKAAQIYEEAGSMASQKDEYEEAADFYEKAADLWKKTENSGRAQKIETKTAETYEKAGNTEYQKGGYEKAAGYYEKAAETWGKTGNQARKTQAEEKALQALGSAAS